MPVAITNIMASWQQKQEMSEKKRKMTTSNKNKKATASTDLVIVM